MSSGHRCRAGHRAVAGAAALLGLAPPGVLHAQDPLFRERSDIEAWARSRARLIDNVEILYLDYSCTAEGVLRPRSACLRAWRRAREGELTATWRFAPEVFKAWVGESFEHPAKWSDAVFESIRQHAREFSRAEKPRSFVCFQNGRYAGWTRNRSGAWVGELLSGGDVFTIRDQLHMALGMGWRGSWFVPSGFDTDTARVLGAGFAARLPLTGGQESVDIWFDERGGMCKAEFFYGRGQEKARSVTLLEVVENEDSRGMFRPSRVSVVPRENEHLPMYFFVVDWQPIERLPDNMLEHPPVAKAGAKIASLVDRVRDTRSQGVQSQQLKDSIERANAAASGNIAAWRWPVFLGSLGILCILLYKWKRRPL